MRAASPLQVSHKHGSRGSPGVLAAVNEEGRAATYDARSEQSQTIASAVSLGAPSLRMGAEAKAASSAPGVSR